MLSDRLKNFRITFSTFWKSKLFIICFLTHITYFIIGLILTLFFLRDFNDFLVYHNVGKVFLSDIENLYDPSNYLWPYRYFPLSGILFVPFSFLPFEVAFILFNVFNLLINFLNCIILYKIINLLSQNEKTLKREIYYLSLYLIALPHAFNYAMGQINSLVSMVLLISLYIFLKHDNLKWNILGGLLVGISLNIKPITIFIVPFLITFTIKFKGKLNIPEIKRSISRLFGASLPILLNLPLLIAIPGLFNGFLEINFVGTETLIVNNSFSITKLIINLLSMLNIDTNLLLDLQIVIFLTIFVLIGVVGFLIFMIRKVQTKSIVYGYILGIIVMLLVYFDSWDLHLIILIPLLIISIIHLEDLSKEDKNRVFFLNSMKRSIYFFIFIDLPLFGLIYILKDIFPYNFIPTSFLLMIYVSLGLYLLKGGNE